MANLIRGKEIALLNDVTATAAELNILDGVTSTAAELNLIDGGTAATSTTLADADRVVVNDAGTMKQVALTDFETHTKAQRANQDLSGTLTSRYFNALTYTLQGDVTVSGTIILGKLWQDGANTTITDDGSTRTITGEGTLAQGVWFS